MATQDITTTLRVDKTPEAVFRAINNVSEWWTAIEGQSQKVGDVFTVRFGKVFITHKVAESVAGKTVVWQVTDSNVSEWVDTRIRFVISVEKNGAAVHFTHIGMVPGLADYEDCVKGWNRFLHQSLSQLITAGKGVPA